MDKQLADDLVQSLQKAVTYSKEQERQQLRKRLLAGCESGVGPVADNAYFEALRKQYGGYQQTGSRLGPNQR